LIYLSTNEIYIASLQGNYSEALPAHAQANIKVSMLSGDIDKTLKQLILRSISHNKTQYKHPNTKQYRLQHKQVNEQNQNDKVYLSLIFLSDLSAVSSFFLVFFD